MLTASIAGYHLAVDLTPHPQQSSLGLATFIREGAPPCLGWPQALPATLAAPFDPAAPPLTWGPAYKEADGAWASLASMPMEAVEVVVQEQSFDTEHFHLHVEYRIGGGPTIWEEYSLTPQGLHYVTHLQWLVGGFRFNMPLRFPAAEMAPVLHLQGGSLTWSHGPHLLQAHAPHVPHGWEIFPGAFSHESDLLRHVGLQSRGLLRYEVHFTMAQSRTDTPVSLLPPHGQEYRSYQNQLFSDFYCK